MKEIKKHVDEAADFLRIEDSPRRALILGTGMSDLLQHIDIEQKWFSTQIPHWPHPTAPTHKNELILGTLHGERLWVLNGRSHYYEGYHLWQVTFAVRVLGTLGVQELYMTNAAGGLQENMAAGDMVFLRDHINLTGQNPLIGQNIDTWGPRFPDMSEAYNTRLLEHGRRIMEQCGLPYRDGIYVGLSGPSLETPAEYGYLHHIGGDLVGMSTIHEVITANHMGMDVCVLSMVTNVSYPPSRVKKTTIDDVIQVVAKHAPQMQEVISALVSQPIEG